MTQSRPLARFFPLMIFLGFVLAMTTCFTLSFSTRSGTNRASDKVPFSGLPDDAEDINFYIPGLMGTAVFYDFKTSEDGFQGWVERHQKADGQNGNPIKLEKQADSNFQIERFNHKAGMPETIAVPDGVLYSWEDEDGKGLYLGFDRASQRAYFHTKAK